MPKKPKTFLEKMNKNVENNTSIITKYKQLNTKDADNILHCASSFFLEKYFSQYQKSDNPEISYNDFNDAVEKMKPFFLCKNKFCSNCTFLRSRKLFVETYNILDNIVNVKNINFIAYHLTLTVKNPAVEHYKTCQDTMNKAFKLLVKSTSKYKLKDFILGYQSSRETTQNKDARLRGELHPHIHVLLLLKPDFISDCNRVQKMTKNDILEEWNSCLKHFDRTFPECTELRMNKIKSKTEAEASIYGKSVDLQNNAIAEVSKYPVKISDLVDMPIEDFKVLDKTLHHARLITYGGIVKTVRAELKFSDEKIEDKFLNPEKYKLYEVKFYELLNKKYIEKPIGELEQAIYEDMKKARKRKPNKPKTKSHVLGECPPV